MIDKRVFIIEHDRIIGLELQRQLEQSSYTVHRPISLVDTEIVVRHYTPDLIIADSNMQQQMGFERIKKYFVRCKLPVICIGTVTNEALKKCGGINIVGTFSKPFDSKDILTLVDKHFKKTLTLTSTVNFTV